MAEVGPKGEFYLDEVHGYPVHGTRLPAISMGTTNVLGLSRPTPNSSIGEKFEFEILSHANEESQIIYWFCGADDPTLRHITCEGEREFTFTVRF